MNGPVTYEELASLMKNRAGANVEPEEMERQPESTFEEFGLDSLGLLGIISELEKRYGVSIEGPESCKTPNALMTLVNDQLSSGV